MDYDLKQICSVFHDGAESPEVMSGLLAAWLHHVRDELDHGLIKLGDQVHVKEFRKRYSELDPVGKMRFLAAPEVSEFLEEPAALAYVGEHRGDITAFEAMLAALHRESLIGAVRKGSAKSPSRDGETWVASSLGDVVAVHSKESDGWHLEECPKIGGLIVVDFDSELSRRYEPESGTFSQPRLALTDAHKLAAILKLERALSLIDEVAPIFGLMIRTFTRRVVVRKTHEAADVLEGQPLPLASEFRPVHSGCIRLLNVHRDEMDVVLCMESLVHETVHSYLSCHEEIRGKFMSTQVTVRPMSPWSGNLIPNHSLAHAVFVYFALCRLFEGCLERLPHFSGLECQQIERRYCDVRIGFLIDRSLSSLFFLDQPPSVDFFDVIDSLQASIALSHGRMPHASAPAPEPA